MHIKILIGFLLVLFLSGCATAKKEYNMEIQQLKNRANSLQAELQTKDQEIEHLEEELEKIREKRVSIHEEKKKRQKISNREIQIALKKAGFYKGPIDDKIGPATKEAIKAFQKANGLRADGVLGNKTKAKIMEYLADRKGDDEIRNFLSKK